MKEPSPRRSRIAIAAGVAAVTIVGAGGFMLGRGIGPAPAPVVAAPPPETVVPAQPEPALPAMLGRRDILELASAAADAAASRQPLAPAVVETVTNRRFTLYLPFGCSGPQSADAPDRGEHLRWRYDEKKGVLRLHVAPQVWQAAQWWPGADAPELEAVEGFWIARPWSSRETCPAGATASPMPQPTVAAAAAEAKAKPAKPPQSESAQVTPADQAIAPSHTLAIAQFFPPDTSRRAVRRGTPFESVIRISPEKFRPQEGFRVRLTGRIVQLPAGDGPVRCVQPYGAEQRPICVVAASIEEVVIENPATGETLGTWSL